MKVTARLINPRYISLLFGFFSFICLGNNSVKIDLSKSDTKDKIQVELLDLKFKNDRDTLCFPAVIPGMYERNNFGKYIEDVYATYENGTILKLKRKNTNTFILNEATQIKKITYSVKSTLKDNSLFLPAGSFFDNDGAFLLNFHALVGYFKSTMNDPYTISIKKNENLFGIGALQKTSDENSTLDAIYARNYRELVDSPFLYSKFEAQDTAVVILKKATVHIAIAPNIYNLNVQIIKNKVEPIMKVLENDSLFGNLFDDKYCLLFCFSDDNLPDQGALEHNRSSVYYFGDTNHIANQIAETVSHELLHIITPLNLRSNLIDSFDFINPVFSQHLWLYEGVTEYLSLKVNLNTKLIDTLTFFRQLRNDFNSGARANIPSLDKFSTNILDKKNQMNYGLIYTKGSVTAFYLDVLIAQASNGSLGISDLLDYAIRKTSVDGVFNEVTFFEEIIRQFPALEKGIRNTVTSSEKVPFDECLDQLGVSFERDTIKRERTNWSFGVNSIQYMFAKNQILIKNQALNDSLGIKKLKIVKINGTPVQLSDMYSIHSPQPNLEVSITIKKNGKYQTLNIKPFLKTYEFYPENLVITDKENSVLKKILSFGI